MKKALSNFISQKQGTDMTIYDIAKEANVSISTVSRVMNNPEKVSAATREHVLAVLRKNNYVPSAFAQGLASNSSKTIAILMSDIRNLHFSMAAYILENYFFEHEYITILCNTGDNLERKKSYIRSLSGKKIDGLVLQGSVFNDPMIERMLADYMPEVPVVISNGELDLKNAYSVMLDQEHGAELLLQHLFDKGYQAIYFVRSNDSQNTQRKIDGFIHAMKKYGLQMNEENNLYWCDYSPSGVMEFAKKMVPLCKNRTACIFYDDYLASCGINAFRDLGLSIPQDIGIVGYDNSRFATISYPHLTTIDTKVEKIALMAANTLHNILTDRPAAEISIVKPELVIREST